MFEKIFLKKYSSEQHQILWQSGEMVEVCSDCVGMYVSVSGGCSARCFIGSVLGLGGPCSVYYDWMR